MDRVVLLGKGDLATKIAGWFLRSPAHDLVYVVPVIPEPAWITSLTNWANNERIPIVESGDFRDLPVLDEPGSIDLAISVYYDRIISKSFIESCDRIINIHNAPLPRYRGVAPINWALKNNEQEHGVTIHEITEGIDDGPIVAQVTFSIYPERDEVIDVYNRALAFAWTLFEQTIPVMKEITPRAQDHANATYYNRKDQARLGDRRNFTISQSQAQDDKS